MSQKMSEWYEVVVRGILGPDEHDDKEIRILNRTVRWEPGGIRIAADDKHVRAVIKAAGLEQDSKGLSVTGGKDEDWGPEDEVELTGCLLYTSPSPRDRG